MSKAEEQFREFINTLLDGYVIEYTYALFAEHSRGTKVSAWTCLVSEEHNPEDIGYIKCLELYPKSKGFSNHQVIYTASVVSSKFQTYSEQGVNNV